MKIIHAALGLVLQILTINSVIIPDELPSLLSVVYSNIPTIKKGTDSRYGWGFRLGNRADFQVLVELGPQIYTQPISQIPGSGNNKRSSINNFKDTLYAQQQHNKKQISNTDGGKWIDMWSQGVQSKKKTPQHAPPSAEPNFGIGEIDAKSVIPDDSTLILKQLYNQKKKMDRVVVTTEKIKTAAFVNDTLDNVDIK